MKKGEIIHGYTILKDFEVIGGTSKVSIASKGEKKYFIKEFLSPKYPLPESPGSLETKQKKMKACEDFEKRHKEIYEQTAKQSAPGGNLVYTVDFFREGTSYYKITENIDKLALPLDEIASLPLSEKLFILKTFTKTVKILHDLHIVHGDLKPDNILLKRSSTGIIVAKLIDFDDSFFEHKPPINKEELAGTPEYYSPELANYIMDEDNLVDGRTIDCKSDIFAMGVIFMEYLTGKKPDVSTTYIWQAKKINVSEADLPELLVDLINNMLSFDVKKRPNINQVFNELKRTEGLKDIPSKATSSGGRRSDLRINIHKKDSDLRIKKESKDLKKDVATEVPSCEGKESKLRISGTLNPAK